MFNGRDYVLCNQCIKRGWLNRARPDLIDDSIGDQDIYDELNNLGVKYYGGDLNIVFDSSLIDVVGRTAQEISKGISVIGTPYFAINGMSCRPSLIKRNGDSYDLVQVVDTTGIKEETISGVSFMTFVIEESGLPVGDIYILYINSSYERGKELDVKRLFIEECVTEMVRLEMVNIASSISVYKNILQSEHQPIVDIGENCDKIKCPYSDYCRSELNIPTNTIFDISGRFLKPSKKYSLYNQRIITFEDIVNNTKMAKLSENAMKQVLAEYEDKHFINKENLKAFVSSVSYPIYHLDFESFTQTIPLYEGIRPYQQVCFQYSLHIEQEDGSIEHQEYLAQEGCNPIKDFVEHLCNDVPDDVTVMVYNKTFEIGRMKEMAEIYPEYADHLLAICENVVDLMVPFMHKDYYVKEMKGSYSIKYVLPALCPGDPELDYHNLDQIHKGDEASAAFKNLINQNSEERNITRRNLLKYCRLDTLAMVKIFRKIREVIKDVAA